MELKIIFSLAFTLILASCSADDDNTAATSVKQAQNELSQAPQLSDEQFVAQALIGSQFSQSTAPEVANYQRLLNRALSAETPVLALDDLKDANAKLAQKLMLRDARMTEFLRVKPGADAYRNEVMSVTPALPADRVGAASSCQLGECYRVDVYNFYFNLTISGVVDVVSEQVLLINSLPETQPDLSERLVTLAQAIADTDPLVQGEISRYQQQLGEPLDSTQMAPLMASTKSSLKNTLCERSQHLCVAPTYVLGDQALWVIVDLTDFKIAGVRWTNVGDSPSEVRGPPQVVTQRKLESEYVYAKFCQSETALARNGWALNYNITASDGLRISGVSFKDAAVFDNAKVVDWHVSYSRSDDFGYSDATGCPMFSSAVVVAHQGPQVEALIDNGEEVGFALTQDFRQQPWPAPCNYRYQERYEFYNDGRYRVAMSNLGRGCGSNGVYRPILRIQFAASTEPKQYAVKEWSSNSWQQLEQEKWVAQQPSTDLFEQRFSHQVTSQGGASYFIEPSAGIFGGDGAQANSDNAFIYVTALHADKDEGERNLVTLGSCCNTNHEQGPEQFMVPPEPLGESNPVLWYVPQMVNNGAPGEEHCWAETMVVDGVRETRSWPCTAGPMFVPAQGVQP